jgi:hypothetical protein
MTKEEAFKELGIRYVGPNVKAKFFDIIEEYAKERVEEMRNDCVWEARNHGNENLADDLQCLGLPSFE